jgi:hypothetical protein
MSTSALEHTIIGIQHDLVRDSCALTAVTAGRSA